jgi:hypothetical protein
MMIQDLAFISILSVDHKKAIMLGYNELGMSRNLLARMDVMQLKNIFYWVLIS